MDQAAGFGGSGSTLDSAWTPPDRRRVLQLGLATVWLVDAVLQLQPLMFSKSFGFLMLGPTARGNPGPVGRSITHVAGAIGRHPVPTNAVLVGVQLLIALAIANRRTVRIGLAASVLWSLLVWWFGEALGELLTGQASPLTGAPGPVLLYGLLAVLLWPGTRRAPFVAGRCLGQASARGVWVLVWGGLGVVALAEAATSHPARLLGTMAAGEPGWLLALNHRLIDATGTHGAALAGLVGAVLLAVAVTGLATAPPRAAVAAAVVVSLAIWVLGEDVGQLFTGTATDPSSGPLLVLFALAYWPARLDRVEVPGPSAPAGLVAVE